MKIIHKHISNTSLDGNYAEDEAISVIFPKFPERVRREKKEEEAADTWNVSFPTES